MLFMRFGVLVIGELLGDDAGVTAARICGGVGWHQKRKPRRLYQGRRGSGLSCVLAGSYAPAGLSHELQHPDRKSVV